MSAEVPRAVWTVAPLGDSALLLECGDRIDDAVNDAVHALHAWIRAQELVGCLDIVPAYASLAVHFDPSVWDSDTLRTRLTAPPGGLLIPTRAPRATVTIPVKYGGEEGPDLDEVASTCGLSPAAVVARHSHTDYGVMFLGFSPGFAYLSGLDPALAVPRRRTPRSRVPAGSVGIGGVQTGIYPSATPGGWQLIGRTDARLFDVHADPPSRLQPGDRVRFQPVPQLCKAPPPASAAPAALNVGFRVERPGLLTTIQDLGRYGYQHLGVTPGGAVDTLSHRLANLLVGNAEDAATLEVTVLGPTLVATRPLWMALCGAPFAATMDGHPLPLNRAVGVIAGARIAIGSAASGARAYLAVAGGFDVPAVLGSRSTALRDHFGGLEGRALRAGDELPVGEPAVEPAIGDAVTASHGDASDEPLRILPGPHWTSLTEALRQTFHDATFIVTPQSDRMGLRLQGPPLPLAAGEGLSAGVATGTIQLPPDGQPIILLADRQTTGGYPRVGDIITADLPRLGQLRPGDSLRLTCCSPLDGREALRAQSRILDRVRARSPRAIR